MQPLWQATVAQHQLAQLWAVRVEPPRSVAEADFVTLARTYVLVGNWSDWGKFVELQRGKGDGTAFSAEVVVPADRDVEFQRVCNGNRKQRLSHRPTVAVELLALVRKIMAVTEGSMGSRTRQVLVWIWTRPANFNSSVSFLAQL